MQRNTKHWRLSVVQVENVHFLLDFSFSTQKERDKFFTMLTVPTSSTVNPPSGLARPRVKSQLTAFFKNHQILSPSLPGMTSFTPQSHFLSGGFIMIFVTVISSAREHELYSMCVHLHKSPNSSKPNQNRMIKYN